MISANRSSARHRAPQRPVLAAIRAVGALLASGMLVLVGCAVSPSTRVVNTGAPPPSAIALVHYTSCGEALRSLRAAALGAVGSGGFAMSGRSSADAGAADASGPAKAPSIPGASAGNSAGGSEGAPTTGQASTATPYSDTNTAEHGVDEPDLVKTGGRYIVTVTRGVLHVVDSQTMQLIGTLDLSAATGGDLGGWIPANLLLAGNHALVLFGPQAADLGAPVMTAPPSLRPSIGSSSARGLGGAVPVGPAAPWPTANRPANPVQIAGSRLLLVDLSTATPRVTSEYTMDGALVDARQVGSIVRVVVHSAPRFIVPPPIGGGGQQPTAANQAMIAHADLSAWLPRYELTIGTARHHRQVGCADISRPATATYSGTSMLSLLTFDLSHGTLDDGQPVTIVADGDTVYSNGGSLYVANNQQWTTPPPGGIQAPGGIQGADTVTGSAQGPAARSTPRSATSASVVSPQQYTGLYKFNISRPGRPVYEAAGAVPGWLLGQSAMAQYALSEWNGALRVATTTSGAAAGWNSQPSQSALYVLQQSGDALVTIGEVGGLGQGEQLYAVRFAGPVGYVVTFQQTDPLYTLDLSDTARPRVAGELLLRGYSAYLHPIDATHLIGVGEDATAHGQTQGTQVSLFDVSNLAAPVRQAVYDVRFGHSEAEFDPHAFLYWPATGTLVIPVQVPSAVPMPGSPPVPSSEVAPAGPTSEAVALQVGDHTITRLGAITHPPAPGLPLGGQIRRSLVIGGSLWTMSDTGLKANALTTLTPLGWVPFE